MSLLTPLYVLGLLAVTVPVLLHLFRPSPRGRVMFSAVMFLDETPPRQTRRTRLENWLLLVLRAAAICLLAIAFARPFLRNESLSPLIEPGRKIGILIDVSASMRRGDVWQQTLAYARDAASHLKPNDEITLLTFDRLPISILTRDEWTRLDPAARLTALSERLNALQPGWGRSNVGSALLAAAEELNQSAGDRPAGTAETPAEIVLITDLAAGSRLEELKTASWPENVRVTLRTVVAKNHTNAGITLAGDAQGVAGVERSEPPVERSTTAPTSNARSAGGSQHTGLPSPPALRGRGAGGERGQRADATASPTVAGVPETNSSTTSITPPSPQPSPPPSGGRGSQTIRLRVTNAADSERSDFRLRWVADSGSFAGDSVTIHVPPGQSRVVAAPVLTDPAVPHRLRLEGDDHDFDNEVRLVSSGMQYLTVLFFGPDEANDPQGLRYYLDRAWPITSERSVQVLGGRDADMRLAAGELDDVPLVVVATPIDDEAAGRLQRFAWRGGTVLVVPAAGDDGAAWGQITQSPAPGLTEANGSEYAILTDTQLDHPLWAAFRDPGFSDFSKIHIWKRRRIDTAALSGATVLARFDAADPAVIETPLGAGRAILFASGWQPRDSQWALSSKFAPLMETLLGLARMTSTLPARLNVGDAIPLAACRGTVEVRTPDDRTISLAAGQSEFASTTLPGLYEVATSGETIRPPQRLVVQIPPEESRTEAIPAEQLEALGVRLTRTIDEQPEATRREEQRQLQSKELEQTQKLWRWLMLATVMIVLAETWIARKSPSRSA